MKFILIFLLLALVQGEKVQLKDAVERGVSLEFSHTATCDEQSFSCNIGFTAELDYIIGTESYTVQAVATYEPCPTPAGVRLVATAGSDELLNEKHTLQDPLVITLPSITIVSSYSCTFYVSFYNHQSTATQFSTNVKIGGTCSVIGQITEYELGQLKFGPDSVCTPLSDCGSCTANTNCKWCIDTEKCLDSQGPIPVCLECNENSFVSQCPEISNSNKKGSSQSTAIALGVMIPLIVIGILLAIGAFIYYKRPQVWESTKSRFSRSPSYRESSSSRTNMYNSKSNIPE